MIWKCICPIRDMTSFESFGQGRGNKCFKSRRRRRNGKWPSVVNFRKLRGKNCAPRVAAEISNHIKSAGLVTTLSDSLGRTAICNYNLKRREGGGGCLEVFTRAGEPSGFGQSPPLIARERLIRKGYNQWGLPECRQERNSFSRFIGRI